EFYDLSCGKYYHYWGSTRFQPVHPIEQSFFAYHALPFTPYKTGLNEAVYEQLYLPFKTHYETKFSGGMQAETELQAVNFFLKYLPFRCNGVFVIDPPGEEAKITFCTGDVDGNGTTDLLY